MWASFFFPHQLQQQNHDKGFFLWEQNAYHIPYVLRNVFITEHIILGLLLKSIDLKLYFNYLTSCIWFIYGQGPYTGTALENIYKLISVETKLEISQFLLWSDVWLFNLICAPMFLFYSWLIQITNKLVQAISQISELSFWFPLKSWIIFKQ